LADFRLIICTNLITSFYLRILWYKLNLYRYQICISIERCFRASLLEFVVWFQMKHPLQVKPANSEIKSGKNWLSICCSIISSLLIVLYYSQQKQTRYKIVYKVSLVCWLLVFYHPQVCSATRLISTSVNFLAANVSPLIFILWFLYYVVNRRGASPVCWYDGQEHDAAGLGWDVWAVWSTRRLCHSGGQRGKQ